MSKQMRAALAAIASLSVAGGMTKLAEAQEAVNTAAAEVTLPPVTIESPKEKISKPARRIVKPAPAPVAEDEPAPAPKKKIAKKVAKPAPSSGGGGGGGQPEPVEAVDTGGDGGGGDVAGIDGTMVDSGKPGSSGISGVHTLGEQDMVGGTAISNDAMRTFSKNRLDEALALAPGVSATDGSGPRNEQLIFVRGFDRFQVPISIDGIRVYRPADNRFDFGAFLTPDMSELQIAKGYTSVLNGPGGMGGAINLVTKKPQKAVEGEVQGGMILGPNGEYEGYKTYLSAGTRQQGYYAQASGVILDTDGWFLSNDFTPTANEDGGRRDHSYKDTWQVNAKIGLTPNATDDYSINFTRGENAHGAPYHISDPIASQRYWDWSGTTTQNIYWLSHTKIGDASFIDSKVYYSTYSDELNGFDDPEQTTQAKAQGKVFRSFYDDWAAGGSLTAGTDITPWDTLKASFYYRRDVHDEHQLFNKAKVKCAAPPCVDEPVQEDKEDTYSVAAENTFHVTRQLDWVAGISYDWRNLMTAEDYNSTKDQLFNYPMEDSDAVNWQTMLVYRLDPDQTVHASVSDRTRFPTIFERFSTRFGIAYTNPGLQPERATNYEIGWSNTFAPHSQISVAGFYSDVKDMIQNVFVKFDPSVGGNVTQTQNVGDGNYYGVEVSADYAISPALLIGGNITWLHRDVTKPDDPTFELTDVPTVKGIVYGTYRVTDQFSITPSVEFANDRWTSKTVGSGNSAKTVFYQTGSYALLNLEAEYDFTQNLSLMLAGHNLTDEDYTLTDGYPSAGRTFYANMRAKF